MQFVVQKSRRFGALRPVGAHQRTRLRFSAFIAPLRCLCLLVSVAAVAADYPTPVQGDHVIRDFRFVSGESLPELRMHYRTWGQPVRDDQGVVRNAVLILHGTTGSSAQFLRAEFAGELFGKGQLLDATRYFIVIPDNLGHGQSSKPSDGLRGKFPRYGYRDMIEAQHRLLLEGLKVNHLRLILGTSMGGMHTWLWGATHPDFMDALLPLASLPTQISGRNRVWRRLIIDAIRTDPEWHGGNYQTQPRGMRTALEMSWLMGNNPVQRLKEAPTLAEADEVLERYLAERLPKVDANDYLYAFEASQDYDPGPGLEKISARLLAINFADDLINPPELGILEREIQRVKRGKAVLIPLSEQTRGHGTHTLAPVWEKHLARLLKQTATRANRLSRNDAEAGQSERGVYAASASEPIGRFVADSTFPITRAAERRERRTPSRWSAVMNDFPKCSRLTRGWPAGQSLSLGLMANAFPASPKPQNERFP